MVLRMYLCLHTVKDSLTSFVSRPAQYKKAAAKHTRILYIFLVMPSIDYPEKVVQLEPYKTMIL
jgi:hypothetical protein